MRNVLVTGGLGYIGSHTVVKLIENGYNVIIIDNLSNSNENVLDKIYQITKVKPKFYQGDIRDSEMLDVLFTENKISDVIHFAAMKSVYESTKNPLEYFDNNVSGTISLLIAMKKHNVTNLIFSSSCTVYGEPDYYPVTETTPLKKPKTAYGQTKSMCEYILECENELNTVCLRYFNPIGNHPTGLIYEKPKGVPENLIPYIIGVIKGEYEFLKVFGDDYNTPDGTAIRDYINVEDLAEAHVKSLGIVDKVDFEVLNVGTGLGFSVLEIIQNFKLKGLEVPYKIYPRREGDIEKIWADISKSKTVLGWSPQKTISQTIDSIITSINVHVDK